MSTEPRHYTWYFESILKTEDCLVLNLEVATEELTFLSLAFPSLSFDLLTILLRKYPLFCHYSFEDNLFFLFVECFLPFLAPEFFFFFFF